MNRNTTIILGAFVIILAVVWMFSGGGISGPDGSEYAGEQVVMHKSPTCGCCGAYGSYLRSFDYDVSINETNNLDQIKTSLGVPEELLSCHTMEIGGYVVEGHVPVEAIEKLLTERPDIKGIGMAGMPAGSPGMPGPQTNDFVVYEITHEDARGDVFVTL